MNTLEVLDAKKRSALQRAREAMVCWWILLRAKLIPGTGYDPQVGHCLQMQKGTKFRLNGGQIELLDDDPLR